MGKLQYTAVIKDSRLTPTYIKMVRATLDHYDDVAVIVITEDENTSILNVYCDRKIRKQDIKALDGIFGVEPVGLQLGTDWSIDSDGSITFTVTRFGALSSNTIYIYNNDKVVDTVNDPSGEVLSFSLHIVRSGIANVYVSQTGNGYNWYSNTLAKELIDRALLQPQLPFPSTLVEWDTTWSAGQEGTSFAHIHNSYRIGFHANESRQLLNLTQQLRLHTKGEYTAIKFRFWIRDLITGDEEVTNPFILTCHEGLNTVSFSAVVPTVNGHEYEISPQWGTTNSRDILSINPNDKPSGVLCKLTL